MLRRNATRALLALSIGATGLAAPGTVYADAVADFYKGRTVTFLVPYPPGGSYDAYGRLFAEHMGKYIPGNPDIIVQNMGGGGGSKGLNYFNKSGPTDGSMLLWPPDAYAVAQLLTPKRAKYKADAMTSLGSVVPVNPVLMVRKDAPATSLAMMKKTEVIVGCTGRSSQSFIMPAMMKYFIGYNWKLICGYKGSAALSLALERGEVQAQSSAWISWRIRYADRINSGELIPVVQVGLARDPELPDLPLMQELAPDAASKTVLEFVSSGSAIGRSLAAAPGTPADRIAALRKAFDATVKDAGLLADAKKRRALVQPTPGADVQAIVERVLATDTALVRRAQEAHAQKPGKCQVNCVKPKKKKQS